MSELLDQITAIRQKLGLSHDATGAENPYAPESSKTEIIIDNLERTEARALAALVVNAGRYAGYESDKSDFNVRLQKSGEGAARRKIQIVGNKDAFKKVALQVADMGRLIDEPGSQVKPQWEVAMELARKIADILPDSRPFPEMDYSAGAGRQPQVILRMLAAPENLVHLIRHHQGEVTLHARDLGSCATAVDLDVRSVQAVKNAVEQYTSHAARHKASEGQVSFRGLS